MFCDFNYNAVAKSNSDRDSVCTMLYRAAIVRVAMTRGAQAIYQPIIEMRDVMYELCFAILATTR